MVKGSRAWGVTLEECLVAWADPEWVEGDLVAVAGDLVADVGSF